MKIQSLVSVFVGLLAVGAEAQTTGSRYAPVNFGDTLFTYLPSNATSSIGVSSVYGSNGSTATLGMGGALVNPMEFNYTVTGPDSALLVTPALGNLPASSTTLQFNGRTGGTYTTLTDGQTSTGTFNLTELPSSVPIGNISVRTVLEAGESTTMGFIISGTMPRQVLIRAIGPGLAAFGVSDVLSNPSFTLYQGSTAIARNDDWGTQVAMTGGSGTTTGTATGTGPTSGTGTLTGTTGTGTGTMTGTTGTATGTTMTGSGASFLVAHDAASMQTFSQVGAFALASGSQDSATLVTLQPGAYTIQVSASTTTVTTGTTGTGTTTGTTTGTGTTTATTGAGTTTGATGTKTTSTGGTLAAAVNSAGEVLLEVYFVE